MMTIETDKKLVTCAEMARLLDLPVNTINTRLYSLKSRGEDVRPVSVDNLELYTPKGETWVRVYTNLIKKHYTQHVMRLVDEWQPSSHAGRAGRVTTITNVETGKVQAFDTAGEAAVAVGCCVMTLGKYARTGDAFNGYKITKS